MLCRNSDNGVTWSGRREYSTQSAWLMLATVCNKQSAKQTAAQWSAVELYCSIISSNYSNWKISMLIGYAQSNVVLKMILNDQKKF